MKIPETCLAVVATATVLCNMTTYAQTVGPDDWLDAGVRAPDWNDYERLFGFTESSSMFDRLVPVEQGEGVVLLIRREVHIDQDDALSIVDEPVGYFFPESSVDDKESPLLNREVDIYGRMGAAIAGLQDDECGPILCLRPLCLEGTSSVAGTGVAGEYVSFAGQSQFVIGRSLSIGFDATDPAYSTVEPERSFVVDYIADRAPIVQDVLIIGTWLTMRQMVAEGCWRSQASETVKDDEYDKKLCAALLGNMYDNPEAAPSVDDLFRPYDPATIEDVWRVTPDERVWIPLPGGLQPVPSGRGECIDKWILCHADAMKKFYARDQEIRADQSDDAGATNIAISCALGGGGIGVGIGALCGTPTGPGMIATAAIGGVIGVVIGGCGGYWYGECVVYADLQADQIAANMERYACDMNSCFNDYNIRVARKECKE